MARKKKIHKEREREAPRVVRNTVHAILARSMILIWTTWTTLFLSLDSLRRSLLIAPLALWFIYLQADRARELAWRIMILIWPQWILSFMLSEERSVAEYAQRYELMEKHKKHRGGSVVFCSKYGISVWRGFLEVIISTNSRNKSWAGSFSLQDLRMSGHRCRIKLEPVFAGTDANLFLDLARLAHLLIGEFSPKGVDIEFVKLLHDYIIMANTHSLALTKGQLLDFLKNHPALKSPRQLTAFISEIFKTYKALGLTEKQNLDAIVSAVTVQDWVKSTIATQDKLLIKVLFYRNNKPNNSVPSYGPTAKEHFRFLRNFQEHGGDCDVTTGDQNIFNMKDLEFIATYEYCSFIHGLILALIAQTDMKGMMLGYAWKNYTEYQPI